MTESVGIVSLIVFHNAYMMNNAYIIGFDAEFCSLPLNVLQQLQSFDLHNNIVSEIWPLTGRWMIGGGNKQ